MVCFTQPSWQDHAVTIQFSLQATRSRSASGISRRLLWVFHLTTQTERQIREAETYNIWGKKGLSPPPRPLLFCVLVCTIVLSLLFEVVAEKSRPSLGASGKNVNTMNLKSKIRLSPFCFSLSREGEESAPYIQPFKCDVLRYRLGEPKHRSANIDSLFI